MRAITSSINLKKPPPLLVLSAYCKKSFLVAKRCAEYEVDNLEVFACMRKFGVWANSFFNTADSEELKRLPLVAFLLFQHLSLKYITYLLS